MSGITFWRISGAYAVVKSIFSVPFDPKKSKRAQPAHRSLGRRWGEVRPLDARVMLELKKVQHSFFVKEAGKPKATESGILRGGRDKLNDRLCETSRSTGKIFGKPRIQNVP